MANPAFQQSGEAADPMRPETEAAAGGELTAHSTAELIAMRDQLLDECLELENRPGSAEGEAAPANSDVVRTRIDEIHQELALRDLAERVESGGRPVQARPPSRAPESPAVGPGLAAQAAQKAFRILDGIETRSLFMDELAQAAREQGRLDQAATFALHAQKLDLERVEVLRKLSALGAEAPDAEN